MVGFPRLYAREEVKSALQREVQRREEAEALHVHFRNCNDDSVYGTVRSLINSIRGDEAEPFPETGLSTSHALETLYDEMEALGGTFLFILDEIDHLSDPDSLLYELPRARANGHLDAARVGVIGISNNYTFRSSLSPKVKDTLMEKELAFSPYDADELQSILTARAEKALVDGACDDSAIRLAAAKAAKDTGSARQAIDLLREGGDIAEERGATAITITSKPLRNACSEVVSRTNSAIRPCTGSSSWSRSHESKRTETFPHGRSRSRRCTNASRESGATIR